MDTEGRRQRWTVGHVLLLVLNGVLLLPLALCLCLALNELITDIPPRNIRAAGKVQLTYTTLASYPLDHHTYLWAAALSPDGRHFALYGMNREHSFCNVDGREFPARDFVDDFTLLQRFHHPIASNNTQHTVSIARNGAVTTTLRVDGLAVPLSMGVLPPAPMGHATFTSPTTFFLGAWRQRPYIASTHDVHGDRIELVRVNGTIFTRVHHGPNPWHAAFCAPETQGFWHAFLLLLALCGGLGVCLRYSKYRLWVLPVYAGISLLTTSILVPIISFTHLLLLSPLVLVALCFLPKFWPHKVVTCGILLTITVLLSFNYSRLINLPGYAPTGAREEPTANGDVWYWHSLLTGIRGPHYYALHTYWNKPIIETAEIDEFKQEVGLPKNTKSMKVPFSPEGSQISAKGNAS